MGAQLRVIRRRVRSVESTKKITKAMELIASSRIIRAERRVRHARPFSERITEVIRNLAATTERLEHPLLERRDEGPVGLVVVTADRGLAGAYNANVLRVTERQRRELGDRARLYVCGKKGMTAFRFRRVDVEESWMGFSDNPVLEDARRVAERLIEDFIEGRISSARLVYNRFVSIMTQTPTSSEILPVAPEELEGGREYPPIYEFEPGPGAILHHLLPMYVEMKVFHAFLEAAASEHAARRRAMSAATDNAEEMIQQLTREANRARQQEITTEIADIVGGAEALRQQEKAEVT